MSEDVSVTIVIIVNKPEIFKDFKNNLSYQKDVNYELVCINNIDNKYNGARIAYNSVKNQLHGRFIIFLHPDIRFTNEYSLKNIINMAKDIKEFGVLGVAGCKENFNKKEGRIFSNIVHGEKKECVGTKVNIPTEVQTVDECFFVIKSDLLQKYFFPNVNGWHLYAVEQCLRYSSLGYKNYVLPVNVWHMSAGNSMDFNYVTQLKRIFNLYGKEFRCINTTVKNWNTGFLYRLIYVNYYYLKQLMKQLIK